MVNEGDIKNLDILTRHINDILSSVQDDKVQQILDELMRESKKKNRKRERIIEIIEKLARHIDDMLSSIQDDKVKQTLDEVKRVLKFYKDMDKNKIKKIKFDFLDGCQTIFLRDKNSGIALIKPRELSTYLKNKIIDEERFSVPTYRDRFLEIFLSKKGVKNLSRLFDLTYHEDFKGIVREFPGFINLCKYCEQPVSPDVQYCGPKCRALFHKYKKSRTERIAEGYIPGRRRKIVSVLSGAAPESTSPAQDPQ